MSYKIYFAGDLFDHKDLTGNLLLAQALEKVSERRLEVMLPQNAECNAQRGCDIRNQDLKQLFECDLLLANFDGPDLDSGTVLEFAYAKMLDLPAVLLRTDFRRCGDAASAELSPWNLMCSGYPRSENLTLHGMLMYHEACLCSTDALEQIKIYHEAIARRIMEKFSVVIAKKSFMQGDFEQTCQWYELAVKSIGSKFDQLMTPEKIRAIVEEKFSKGLYS
ncbi:MAG: nucleoside 2-deoxyribosyltransferase [Victivallaceae bacterium]